MATKQQDIGLVILRVGIGIMMILHGYPKLMGGVEQWEGLGQAMGVFGITFAPVFWGFIAALTEVAGGIALAVGLLYRPFLILLSIEMVVAAGMHISQGDGLVKWSHAVELLILFISLLFIGTGRYALNRRLPGFKDHWFG